MRVGQTLAGLLNATLVRIHLLILAGLSDHVYRVMRTRFSVSVVYNQLIFDIQCRVDRGSK